MGVLDRRGYRDGPSGSLQRAYKNTRPSGNLKPNPSDTRKRTTVNPNGQPVSDTFILTNKANKNAETAKPSAKLQTLNPLSRIGCKAGLAFRSPRSQTKKKNDWSLEFQVLSPEPHSTLEPQKTNSARSRESKIRRLGMIRGVVGIT